MRDSKNKRSISPYPDKQDQQAISNQKNYAYVADPSRAKQLQAEQTLCEESWPSSMRPSKAGGRFAVFVKRGDPSFNGMSAGNDLVFGGLSSLCHSLPLALRKCTG